MACLAPTGNVLAQVCGDGNLEFPEECDDGNNVNGDGCDEFCFFEFTCGDGNLDAGEECDDGNNTNGDGCDEFCFFEFTCGDGTLEPPFEECDDGNNANGDGCDEFCLVEPFCGDGNQDAGEQCDDGNNANGDGCDEFCLVEPFCGDGNQDAGEQCDDGNNVNGDGCDLNCAINQDRDGVSDQTEDQAPNNGDGNNDGIRDSEQENVTSLRNAKDGSYVTLEAQQGTTLEGVGAIKNPSPKNAPPVKFPVDFFRFSVQGVDAGGATTITLFLHGGGAVRTYYKFGPTPDDPAPHWYEFLFDGETGAEILSDRIILHLVDGGRGDDDLTVNGEISDPGASALDETVLVANFVNGNDTALNSRVYLWNPSTSAGDVMVRVFTLPLVGGTTQELTATPLSLGTLFAKRALNVNLAEDILTPLGISLPYMTDGGNLTVEFTIQAPDVRGVAQVFSDSLAFGTYPLQEIPSTPSTSPTVLAANFTNGNNAALNTRIYLWNPSMGAGEVTVRVFTLPTIGGLAQELTTSPLSLGTLGARSALNLRVAEDILVPLGVPTPYTTDGGNLALEISIQAADVGGAVQVFSSDFAFGTYPLEKLPSTSAGSPTVLVANFTNGNDDTFNSRIYLWNPSAGAGNVTVRVFTLPLMGGTVQELTDTPLSLGTLGAKSALNIKLAEDILTPLGITIPYTADGGNLTLEFTIEAADVGGIVQVFSSSLGLGIYPMQETQ